MQQTIQQTMSATERKVIDILVKHEQTPSPYGTPIHAVDRAIGWATMDTTKFVEDLVERGLVHWTAVVRDGPIYDPKTYWKEGRLQ